MVDSAERTRVRRLLSEEFRPEDLTRLLIFARDQKGLRNSVWEIGGFISHRTERSIGSVTDKARDWLTVARYAIRNRRSRDPTRLPSNFPEVLQASLRRLPSAIIQAKTGIPHHKVSKLLPELCSKFIRNPDATLSVSPSHTELDYRIAECLSTIVTDGPVFTGEQLYQDLETALVSTNVLLPSERRAFKVLKPTLCMMAIAEMQNAVIRIDGDETVTLQAEVNPRGVLVSTTAPVEGLFGQTSQLPGRLFGASFDAHSHCHPSLLMIPQPWPFYLELTASRYLARLA